MKSKSIFIILSFVLLLINCSNKKTKKEYYPNGVLKTEYQEINKVMEGQYRTFYPSGRIQYEVHVKNGLREGVEKLYYENGNLHKVGVCKNNKDHRWCNNTHLYL